MNPLSHMSGNEERNRLVQDTCTTDGIEEPRSSGKNSSYLIVYVCLSLGVIFVFAVIAAVIVIKKHRVSTRDSSVSKDEEESLLPPDSTIEETDCCVAHSSYEEDTSFT